MVSDAIDSSMIASFSSYAYIYSKLIVLVDLPASRNSAGTYWDINAMPTNCRSLQTLVWRMIEKYTLTLYLYISGRHFNCPKIVEHFQTYM